MVPRQHFKNHHQLIKAEWSYKYIILSEILQQNLIRRPVYTGDFFAPHDLVRDFESPEWPGGEVFLYFMEIFKSK